MSKLTLFQTTSPYIGDINKGDKLTPSELDNNFLELKGDDIKSIEYDKSELTITFNNGEKLKTIITTDDVTTTDKGDKIIDFKSLNNNILLQTDKKTYSVSIDDFPIIKEVSKLTEIVSGKYNANTGILTLTKSDGNQINVSGFFNQLSEGLIDKADLFGQELVLTMKNGDIKSVDLSSLVTTLNVETYDFQNKIVRINQIKSNSTQPLKINEHLLVTNDMTIERKQMTVGDNDVPGTNSLAVGDGNTVTGANSLSVGKDNTSKSDNNFTMGLNNLIERVGTGGSADSAAAIGRENTVNANQALAHGYLNKILGGGSYSLASGTENEIGGQSAQGFGIRTKVGGTADAAMAQGFETVANGKYSFASGKGSKALSEASHAEGTNTVANYTNAHAEGSETLAEGFGAHAEGVNTKAKDKAAHAEGQNNETRALASHVQGSNNLITDGAKYSFAGGINNIVEAEKSFVFGENNTTDPGCKENVYVLGRNINATTRDTLYINKLNINDLEQVNKLRKYFVQQDTNGTLYKINSTDVLEMLSGDYTIITNGQFVNYGPESDDNKIILKGEIDGYEVVIDKIENTHITSGSYNSHNRHLYLTDNSGKTIDIDLSAGNLPLLEVKVKTDKTLVGDGTTINPLRIAPNERTGQLQPAKEIVSALPTTGMVPGDRYVITQEVITKGYLYAFDDVKEVNFGNGWRIPTRADWDSLLNDMEPDTANKNHDEVGVSGWRGAVAGTNLKANSFGGQDVLDFNVLPVQYMNSDGSLGTPENTKFWSISRVLDKWDVFTKRFNLNEGRVFNEPVAPVNEKLSIRLVRDIIDDYTGVTNINGKLYNTIITPNQKMWLTTNLADTTIPHADPAGGGTKMASVVAEWDGIKWSYQEIKEGYTIVVLEGVDKCVEYKVKEGVLVVNENSTATSLTHRVEVLETKVETLEDDVDNLKVLTTAHTTSIQNLETEVKNKIDKNGIKNTLFGVVDDKLFEIPQGTSDVFVNSEATHNDDLTNGSQFFPYKTITQALNAIPNTESKTVYLSSGCEFDEGVVLTFNDRQNLSVIVDGADDQFRTTITGNVNITGNSGELGIKGLKVLGNLTLSPVTNTDIYLTNLSINGITTINGDGYYYLKDCQFLNNLIINGNNTCYIVIEGGSNERESIFSVNNPNAVVVIKDVTNVTLNLIRGHVLVQGSTNFITSPNLPGGKCITAQSGLIDLMDGTAQQSDSTYAPIAIGPSAQYSLGKFLFDPTNSDLNGTLSNVGLHSIQIYDTNDRTGYTKTGNQLKNHLDGISNVLKGNTDKITNLETDVNKNTSDIATLKGGIGFLPSHNFGNPLDTTLYPSPTTWQKALNDYANGLGITPKNGLSVKNLFNNHRWTYSDTLLEWTNQGMDVVSIATNTTAGVVRGVDPIIGGLGTVAISNANGEMSVNGLKNALDLKSDLSYVNTQLALKADVSNVNNMNTLLQSQLDTHQASITQLNSDLVAEINNRNTQVNDVKTNVTALEARVTTLETENATLKTKIATLENNVITTGAFDSVSGNILLTTASGDTITVTLTGIGNFGKF